LLQCAKVLITPKGATKGASRSYLGRIFTGIL